LKQVESQQLRAAQHLPGALFSVAAATPSHPAQWYRTADAYHPLTYAQLASRTRHVATGLMSAGLGAGDRVALLMENRPEWAVVDYAVLAIGGVTVPLYCSYRPQDMAYVLNDADVRMVICSGGILLQHLLKAIEDCPQVEAVYALEPAGDHSRLHPFVELEAHGVDVATLEDRMAAINRASLASIVYTSGTTAMPKGVMLSHGNLLAVVEAASDVIDLYADDMMLSFLPLAHSLERLAGHYLVYSNGLSVAFAERPDTVAKNLAEARPTLLISVPRMFEVVRGRILAQAAKQPAWQRSLFEIYVSLGQVKYRRQATPFSHLAYALLDRLVGRKIRQRFGGRLRLMVSGGAPLSTEVNEFFEGIGMPILQGYGLTESAPLISVNPPEDRRLGTVGPPVTGVEVRLADDGEILARGANIMLGYWHQPEATAEVVVDGWLHTGDIGVIDADGYLRITDRKKDILVTSGGENIAPQRIEMLLVADPMIDQVVVFGDQRPYLVAIVVPNEEACQAWATGKGLPAAEWKSLSASPVLRKELQNRIAEMLKPLNPYEQVRRIHVRAEPFTIESGLLTPTLKIKRRQVLEMFRDEIGALYQ
jgi:long-chain acyl-CoA synthetase